LKLATRQNESRQLQHRTRARRTLPVTFILLLLSTALLTAILLAVSFGSTPIPLSTIAQILLNGTGLFHFARQWDSSAELIVWQVRMPVVVGAALVGAALSVAGVLFQGLLRNPLADPFLIGTSSGAALGAAVAFVLPFDTIYGTFFPLTPLLAFAGAVTAVLVVYAIARAGGQAPVVTLLLAGVVINAVLEALQTLILTVGPQFIVGLQAQFSVNALFFWLAGGVSVTSWPPVFVVGALILVGILAALSFSSVLDVFALGEEGAAHLGLHVERCEAPLSSRQGASTQSQRRNVPVLAYVGHFLPRVFVCNLRRGWWALLRQRLAQLSFGTLMLLPTGTIYRGTQRNTIGLSVCNGCLPWGSGPSLRSG
jgi:iron complex transport system permease protein